MRLLFDHNLSPRLMHRLADLYPDTSHVSRVGLERASDLAVWTYAQTSDYIIVTKDTDFSDISVLRGFPPKVIWLRLGNCTTGDVERTLRNGYAIITAFATDPTAGMLALL
jgi:predicted nuclease of predicted toxin-antitoxin system